MFFVVPFLTSAGGVLNSNGWSLYEYDQVKGMEFEQFLVWEFVGVLFSVVLYVSIKSAMPCS